VIDPSRTPPAVLWQHFNDLVAEPSDINEHLSLLCALAQQCEHVTEFGMRGAVSTVAFLAAQPATLVSWDLNPAAVVSQRTADLLAVAGRTSFQPRVGDTLQIAPIEPTDLLFIDTLHTARQLLAELERHVDPVADPVKKYLVFHDTATFGMVGEDGSEPGLRAAIRHFQRNHAFPLWELAEDRENCNGLVVLRHV
jgi:cephalosporin hydroxylase